MVTGTSRTGVLRAVIERATVFKTLSQSISDVRLFSFLLDILYIYIFPDRGHFSDCILSF